MKSLLFISVIVLLFSCTKQNRNAAINEVLNQKDKVTQKTMYSKLSATEKFDIWDEKFDNLLKSYSFTKEQRDLIENVRSSMSVKSFSEIHNEPDPYWERAVTYFGDNAYQIFASVNSTEPLRTDLVGRPDCQCSTKSDYCDGSSKCATTDCSEGLFCGTLLMYKCNGMCRVETP